ncbi:hypothetical protein ACROYT_G041517 [Oculina patagonica]
MEIPKLEDKERDELDGPLTYEECKKSLEAFQNGKSPGVDGLTVEFYKHFFDLIGLDLLASLNRAYEFGRLSISQRRGIITLLPKEDAELLLLQNWRPITLLNVDYKIASKAIAMRIEPMLPKLVHPDQTGFVKGRYIGENVRLIFDIMEQTRVNNIPGILISVDFKKAFDSLEWSCIQSTLQKFNFGDSVRKWIKIFYTDIESAALNNGFATDWFKPSRGVRQGCPLSPFLFIVTAEVLSNKIRQNPTVKGIRLFGSEVKLSQFADDTNLFCGDLTSVEQALDTVNVFGKFSGLMLNVEKTKAIWLGKWSKNKTKPLGMKWIEVPDTWKRGEPNCMQDPERILHTQITERFESIFHDFMFAYRKFHGCPAALLTLTERWKEQLDKREVIGAAAIDLSKAFDCLPHDLILDKLKFCGMDDTSLELLRSYLSSRFQRVQLSGTYSAWKEVSRGVPQGSILGPLLFNIFMNDMIYAIRECRLLSYADDTKIYHSHASPGAVELAVNQDLDNAATWFKENGMKANPDKYQAIVLGKNSQEISLKSGDINIPIKDQISLLGVTLDSKLKFDAHVAIVCRKVSSQVNALNRLKTILPLKTKQSLYRSFILPHFYYCSQVWHHCGKRNTRKLEKVNERALRYVFKDKKSSYEQLLKRMSSQTLQNRQIQDMLCTINNCLSNKAPPSIKNLVSLRGCSYNLRGENMLALPKVNTTK